IAPSSTGSLPERKSADGSSMFNRFPRKRPAHRLGDADAKGISTAPRRSGSKSRSAIRSISHRLRFLEVCTIVWCESPHLKNPEFIRAQAMRLPTYGKPRVVGCAEAGADSIGLPRGCLGEVLDLLHGVGVNVVVQDVRNVGRPLDATFQGELYPDQAIAAEDL